MIGKVREDKRQDDHSSRPAARQRPDYYMKRCSALSFSFLKHFFLDLWMEVSEIGKCASEAKEKVAISDWRFLSRQ